MRGGGRGAVGKAGREDIKVAFAVSIKMDLMPKSKRKAKTKSR